jgi:two-component system, chemotaxis family, response regulator Rcp1
VKPARHILLVEDNDGDVELVERAVSRQKQRCTLSVAPNGGEGLDYVYRRGKFPQATRPDIVLLDINMPGVGGLRFLEVIKRDEEFRSIPVIMLSSSAAAQEIVACYRRHANCYVTKPFDGRAFIDTVNQLLIFWLGTVQLPPQEQTSLWHG